jgi:transposase
MMGRRERGQGQFFYSFDLDRVVPPDHLVRQIDGILDLGWVHKELGSYYSHTGRPSIDPVLMIRMLLVGYVFAIRSERRLCSEVQVNLAYRWFCKLSFAVWSAPGPSTSMTAEAMGIEVNHEDAIRIAPQQKPGDWLEYSPLLRCWRADGCTTNFPVKARSSLSRTLIPTTSSSSWRVCCCIGDRNGF